MKIGFVFFGIIYGPGGKTGSDRDFRHCWPNLKRMVIDPFVKRGHEARIYFSGYPFTDKEIEKQFYEMVKPDGVVFSKFENSNALVTKTSAFGAFMNTDNDVIIFTRSDIHYSKIIAEMNIDFHKFNFFFKEASGWWKHQRFTNDNLYIFPNSLSPKVFAALMDMKERSPNIHTHELLVYLEKYLSMDDIHVILDEENLSDMNKYYTLCRSELRKECRGEYMHEEVRARFPEYEN